MTSSRINILNQELDIGGSTAPIDTLNVADEANGLGMIIAGRNGNTAAVFSLNGNSATITGLSGFTGNELGNAITISGANSSANNGTFVIIAINSATSINIDNPNAIIGDLNNGNIIWQERKPYSLQDDLNYQRTDRSNIKGVSYAAPLPTYQRPTAIGTNVPANLNNISGKTWDAVGFIMPIIHENVTVLDGYTKVTLFEINDHRHSDPINKTGVPCFDAVPYLNNYSACYVNILNPDNGDHLVVISGPHTDERIFGLTNAGSSSSPDSIEILFYSAPIGADISAQSTPYIWELTQVSPITLTHGYFTQADQLDENSFRNVEVLGFGSFSEDHKHLRQLIHLATDGAFEGFPSGMFQELLPSGDPFPTSIIWWESSAKLKKIISEDITYNDNHTVNTYQWKVYDMDGMTSLATVTDTMSYNGVFLTSRSRTVS